MMLKKIFLFAFILNTSISYSQKNNFNLYTVKNGLPQNTVYKIFQDSKGYIWFGTDGGGVSKFDGRKHIYFDKKNGLAGNVVRDIIEDRKGNLWFATDEGVSVFNGIKFQNKNSTNGLLNDIVVKVFEDSKERIWVGTANGGASLLTLKDSISVKNFTTDDGLASNYVFSILEDNYNRIWFGYVGGPPQIISYEKEKLTIQEINTNFNYDLNSVYCGTIDDEGNIWYGTIKNGVFKFENISPKSTPNILSYSILNGLKDNYILDICEDNATIWIASNDGGVHYLKDNKFHYLDTKDGLPSNQILDVFSDREKNIWLSCMGEGILKLNGFEFSHYSTNDGLKSNRISQIKKNEADSTFWVSSFNQGLQVLKIVNEQILEKENILQENPFYNSIKTFDFDQQNNVWIGTQNGIVLWNKKIIATYTAENELAGDQINSILCAKSGTVWIGTSSGLSFYNGEVFGVFTEDDGLINNEIQTIIEAKDGTIWIGTLGGLISYKNNSMTSYDEQEGLANLKVHSLIEASNGNIIIGTYGGGVFMLNNKKIQPLIFDKELTSNNVYALCFENDSTLIIGTDKGMDKAFFDKKFALKFVTHYNENNGFLSIENNLNAVYFDHSFSTIYFGTVNGITAYKPFLEQPIIYKPTIHLETIKLFNQHVDWRKYGEVSNLNLPINLELPFNKNFITFSFNTIHFKNPKNISYQYKLMGFNDEWYNSESSDIVFQGLEPNTYHLQVKSITENGLESTIYEFSFIIVPPFYKTWWFYTISILFIITAIIIYIRLNLKRLKKEKIVLEKTVRERTKEVVNQKNIIEEKNKEITDSITYAQRIQLAILPDEEKLNNYFTEYFVLFNPKDIVSGDFYWVNKKDYRLYFMAADCTGHGVPGAIMSIIGHTSLETTLKNSNTLNAGEFLDLLNTNMINTLLQSKQHSIKDGMDVALCIYDEKKNTLEYAGANNPLYIIRKRTNGFDNVLTQEQLALSNDDYNLFEFKADKQPIGDFDHRTNFNTHTINLLSGDTIYLFSDGFADQFGGDKGKKYKYKPFKQYLLDIQSDNLPVQKEKLNNELNNWMHPLNDTQHYEQVDDMLIISIRIV